MRCEVCGNEIRGQPYYRVIEGARMTVCGRCSRYGASEWDPRQPIGRRRARATTRRPRSEVEAAEVLELVEDYGAKIRKARQKMGLTVEELAKIIMEKESVVKKLEREELNPDHKLAQKIRKTLNLELLVTEETPAGAVMGRPSHGRTLGDIIKMKRPPSEEEPE